MEFGNTNEVFVNLRRFPTSLFENVHVLVLASSALGGEGTGWIVDAVGGGFEDGDEVGVGVFGVVAIDFDSDEFVGYYIWDHYYPFFGGGIGRGGVGVDFRVGGGFCLGRERCSTDSDAEVGEGFYSEC